MNKQFDLLELYKNYLYAVQIREMYGDKYGDTEELIKMYEELLGIKENASVLKMEKK